MKRMARWCRVPSCFFLDLRTHIRVDHVRHHAERQWRTRKWSRQQWRRVADQPSPSEVSRIEKVAQARSLSDSLPFQVDPPLRRNLGSTLASLVRVRLRNQHVSPTQRTILQQCSAVEHGDSHHQSARRQRPAMETGLSLRHRHWLGASVPAGKGFHCSHGIIFGLQGPRSVSVGIAMRDNGL